MKNIVFALGLMFTSGSALAAEPLYLKYLTVSYKQQTINTIISD